MSSTSINFDHEDKSMIKINSYDNNVNYELSENPLICLNHALAENGFSLEVSENYKFNKTLVVYNFFTKDVKDKLSMSWATMDSHSFMLIVRRLVPMDISPKHLLDCRGSGGVGEGAGAK